MSRPVYGIRFAMTKERTGNRRGPRFRIVPDESGLFGARKLAAGMVRTALGYRDSWKSETHPMLVKMRRAQMRQMALWARVWAGQIDQDDARIDAAARKSHACCVAYCNPGIAA